MEQTVTVLDSNHCAHGELMGGFGIFIQGILGFIAFSTLMIKRMREPKKTRRSWTTWFYDTSKQGFGALFIHFANIFLADDLAADDPCTFYLISFLLDSTIGLLIIYGGLKFCQHLVKQFQCSSLTFGEYGSPPECKAWFGQCTLYIAVMLTEKLCVFLLVLPDFWKDVRHYMLSWIHNPQVEVLLTVLVIPFVVNTLTFWVVDSILMKRYSTVGTNTCKTVLPSVKSEKYITKPLIYRTTSNFESSDTSCEEKHGGSGKIRYHKLNDSSDGDTKPARKDEETMLLLQDPEIVNDKRNRVSSVTMEPL